MESLRGVGIYIIRLGDGISPGLWRTGPVGPFSKSAIHGPSCTSKRLHLQAEHRSSQPSSASAAACRIHVCTNQL